MATEPISPKVQKGLRLADILKKAWWVLLLRGIAAILFALLLIFAPEITLTGGILSFVIVFAAYALIDGGSNIIAALMRREGQWLLLLISGIISVVAGAIALANPLMFGVLTLTIMVYIVAFRSIFVGILEMISAWRLRQDIDNEWILAIDGILSVLFGLLLLYRPVTGIEVLVLLTAFYAFMAGVLQIVLGFKVRGWSGALAERKAASAA